jgi:ATP-dependent metalloprotease FtsH
MDDKSDRRLKTADYWKHHTVTQFLKEHKQPVGSGVLIVIMLVLLIGIFRQLQAPATSQPPAGVTVVDYSTFVAQVKTSNVLLVNMRGNEITGTVHYTLQGQTCNTPAGTAITDPFISMQWWFSGFSPATCTIFTYLPARSDSALLSLLLSHGVVIYTHPLEQSPIWQSLFWLLIPVVFLLVLWNIPPRNNKFSLDSMDKSVSKFLHSRVRRFDRTPEPGEPRTTKPEHEAIVPQKKPAVSLKSHTSPVTFADVAGIDEVRAELEEVVQFLRSPSKFNRLGAHIPRGILLVGAPGTGKTLLAKAVAGEANVPFFPMSASEFIEMFVGVGASRVRDLFQQARQSAPCVIFLDEIDAIGRKRSIKVTGNGERDQTLNQLLVELDGFNSRSTVIVLAATNRVDILDTALLRPGRFDRQITISLPDRVGREAILRVHTRTTPLHSSVQLESLARQTTGMSGADLANLVNEAALTAARRSLDCVTQACFEEALERIQLGARRPLILGKADQRIIAFHESGHALVAYYLPEADSVSSISMLPRGQHLGVTQFTTQEDRYNFSRETLMARLAVGLGGRVAEELTFGPGGVTTGAENDLQAVTALAWRMVTHWGMGKQVGTVFADYCEAGGAPLQYLVTQPVQSGLAEEQGAGYLHTYHAHTPATRFISSPTMATLIDAEVQHILNDGHETARALLTEHCTQLTRLAQALIEHEQLNRAEFEKVLQQ